MGKYKNSHTHRKKLTKIKNDNVKFKILRFWIVILHFDFYILHLIVVQNQNNQVIQLKHGNSTVDEVHLTISQGFDNMLITAIDRLIIKNKISKLSLKSFKVLGKIRSESVSGMTIKTILIALEI